MSENKTGKYLKYAIGEILLVMIGILLALQVNNWNEGNKLISKEGAYLQELNEEFISNKDKLSSFIRLLKRSLNMAEVLLSLRNNDTITSNDIEILTSIETVGWAREINFTKDVWNDIYSTGNAMIFNDMELQNQMSAFYTRAIYFESLIAELSRYGENYRNLSKNIINPMVRVELAKKIVGSDTTKIFKNRYNLENILIRFKSNELVGGEIADIIMVTKVAIWTGERLNERIDATILMIENNLD